MMREPEEETISVTGATDGLDRRVAQELAARGATVLLHLARLSTGHGETLLT
jgi:NAD(P)-dependent dehydrogenase (short-subunit alcohol dehydrogenase family)